jgi:chorismate-pyruvate lyase
MCTLSSRLGPVRAWAPPVRCGLQHRQDGYNWPETTRIETMTVHSRSPCGVASVDLDPFDRMVLTTDGTVTTLLAACTAEPIATRTMRQAGPATLETLLAATGCWWQPDAALLDLTPSERVVARRVILEGASSRVAYVVTESVIATDRLPGSLADGLQRTGASLGRVLAASCQDTRRELLHLTSSRAGEDAEYLDVHPDVMVARRSYLIVVGQRTAAIVTETLPRGPLAATALGVRQ